MEPKRKRARAVGALLSSLVSETAFLLLHLVPSITKPLLSPHTQRPSDPFTSVAIQNLFSSSQIVASMIAAGGPSRKRRRVVSDSDDSRTESETLPATEFPLAAGPDHFPLFFRMSSSTFQYLCGLLEPLLDCCSDPAAPALSPSARLAIGLFRLATGSPYADLVRRFAVPESAARFSVKRLCRVLCTNFRFWLAFPSSHSELSSISSAFESLHHAGLPGCCGAMAPAWFRTSDGGDVIANVVSDPSCKILSLTVGHQSQASGPWKTLRSSSLYQDVEEGRLLAPHSYLIGSKSYPLLPWVMVPFTDALAGSKEEGFNAAHDSMLKPVLRTNSSMRNWGVLSNQILDEDTRMTVACIGTCAILHNMLLMREDYSALSNEVGELLLDDECNMLSLENGDSTETTASKEATDARRVLTEKVKISYNLNETIGMDNK